VDEFDYPKMRKIKICFHRRVTLCNIYRTSFSSKVSFWNR